MNVKFGAAGAGIISALLLVMLVGSQMAGLASPPTVELFDWKSWSEQQEHLIHSADALTGRLSSAQQTGTALRQKLGDISHLVMPHKIIPMDQALAMLKVQKQMRSEDQEPHDRIEGAGDVAGLVDEQDEAMERNALREPAEGADLDTSNLFENCEDGSLTAEDAELCQRRASAIKLLTKSAVNAQLADAMAAQAAAAQAAATPVRRKVVSDAQRELIAEAKVGKEYLERLRLLNERKQGLVSGMRKKAVHTAHALSQGDVPAPLLSLATQNSHVERGVGGEKMHCTCTHKAAHGAKEYLDGTSPLCSCSGGEATSLVQQPLPATPLPASLPHKAASPLPPAPSKHAAHAWGQKQKQAVSTESTSTSTSTGVTQEAGKGALGALARIAAAASAPAAERVGASKSLAATRAADLGKGAKELAALEAKISAGEAALAKQKLRFTEELTRRQAKLQAAFVESMADVRQGLSLVDSVPLSSSLLPNSPQPSPATAANALSSQASAGAVGGVPVSEALGQVEASPLFQHPPPAAAPAPKHPSEKATLRAALDDQFAQVASVRAGSGAPREQRLAEELEKPVAAGEAQEQQRRRRALALRQALRLSHSLPQHPRAQAVDHVGAGSYAALWAAARRDLSAATSPRQRPTLHAAADKALAADKAGKAGPAAELSDAEAVLCTVARLEKGLCSGAAHARAGGARLGPRHPRRPTQTLRLLGQRPKQVVAPPSVATLATDRKSVV